MPRDRHCGRRRLAAPPAGHDLLLLLLLPVRAPHEAPQGSRPRSQQARGALNAALSASCCGLQLPHLLRSNCFTCWLRLPVADALLCDTPVPASSQCHTLQPLPRHQFQHTNGNAKTVRARSAHLKRIPTLLLATAAPSSRCLRVVQPYEYHASPAVLATAPSPAATSPYVAPNGTTPSYGVPAGRNTAPGPHCSVK